MLNPPGGSSSNIFGGYDNQQLQRTPAQTNPESINRVKNSDVGRGPQAAAATGPRAPRCGDDSFLTSQGIYQSSGHDKAIPRNSSPLPGLQNPSPRFLGRRCSSHANTFLNIFGSGSLEHRNMFRKVLNSGDDSFSRVFGQKSLVESKGSTVSSTDPALRMASASLSECVSADSMSHLNQSNTCKVVTKESKMGLERRASSQSQMFGANRDLVDRAIAGARRFSSKSGKGEVIPTCFPFHLT